MDISGTQLRAVRAALFTAFVVTLSTASHVLLSQVPLPLPTVAAVAAGVFVTAYALAGRERGFGHIAALLIPLELAADTVFTTGQHACYGRAGGPVAGPLRAVGLDVLCQGGTVGAPLAQVTGGPGRAAALLAHADPVAAWLLLAAHVCVGLLAACWLRRGERALAQLLRAVAATTFRPLLLAVAAVAVVVRRTPARRLPRPAPRTTAARDRLLVHSLGRRGPPCSCSPAPSAAPVSPVSSATPAAPAAPAFA
ncbi:hypothetical protein [Streptomyces shenzhenensis]|uniref:Integral membrane protein n=1 Tax=Streptomyces shenzhenensis TaxID=943815 RepID=A0A3M0IY60_9ACTN|nr:hypothetical protein [Streptomyces shenzhenensis]RMB87246.1 hypothetical protein CTZ28_04815 [Streptomyces shenzhenensis]